MLAFRKSSSLLGENARDRDVFRAEFRLTPTFLKHTGHIELHNVSLQVLQGSASALFLMQLLRHRIFHMG